MYNQEEYLAAKKIVIEYEKEQRINLENKPKSRCCGRCDGIIDICVADMTCKPHNEQGCEICYGPRMQ